METINIFSFSKEAASKSKGALLREKLEALIIEGKKIAVDFSNINRYASPFFNNSFAALGLVHGFDIVEAIELINITDIGRNTYEVSLENAKVIFNNPQFSSEIDKIINNTPKKVE